MRKEWAQLDVTGPTRQLLKRRGFDVLDAFDLPSPLIKDLALYFSVQPVDIGLDIPMLALVAIDLSPWPAEQANGTNHTDNLRLKRLSNVELLLSEHPEHKAAEERKQPQKVNRKLFFWTAHSEAAWQVLARWVPAKLALYQHEAQRRMKTMTPPFPVLLHFGKFNNNAEVLLVRYGKIEVICKVFRPGREKHFKNELAAASLATSIEEISPILARGDNWLLTPFFADAKPLVQILNRWGLIPLPLVKQAFSALKKLHEAGYAHLDFHPEHVLVTKSGQIYLIDFDRLHTFDDIPPFDQSPALLGFQDVIAFNGPNGRAFTYKDEWRPYVGLPLKSLLYEPIPYRLVAASS